MTDGKIMGRAFPLQFSQQSVNSGFAAGGSRPALSSDSLQSRSAHHHQHTDY